MRTIEAGTVKDAVRRLFLEACIAPSEEVQAELENRLTSEKTPHAREILRQLTENNRIATKSGMPACQDTGMAIVFADIGQEVQVVGGDFTAAVNEGVMSAYKDGYFRKSVLDPLTRKNTGDNLPAVIHTRIVPGDKITLTAVPKGFGSENMSRIAMLRPSDGTAGIVDFVLRAAREAGGSPCPPVVIGIGIGGTFESCALASKRALLRRLGAPSERSDAAALEREIMEKLNSFGIGPMGLGGSTYCLAVHINVEPTHIAALPAAVNFCCHMLRHKKVIL